MNPSTTSVLLLGLVLFFTDLLGIRSVTSQEIQINEPLQYDPPKNGAPGGNRSGRDPGSRDDCPVVEKPITAINPVNNWGNTLTERPTLWFYIPYEQGILTLLLRDEDTSEIVARVDYSVSQGERIIGFPLPTTVPALDIDQAYRWRVYFSCDPNIEVTATEVEGVVQRVAVSDELETQLTSATLQEQIRLYAKEGLWYDTITTLVESRCADADNPDLAQDWSDLLADPDVALEQMIPETFQCCYPMRN